ncbi:MAG TPA: heavy metal sensor histidine kinase [Chthoniobacterales bacterium]|nr:heavy metal sensor histidine kinase [Chthoniobacterales bacterium]
MSSDLTKPRSISSQLVFLFALSAALLLASGLGVFYFLVVRHAMEEDDEVLTDKLFALRTDVERDARVDALNQEFATLSTHERAMFWMRVINPAGQTVAETPGMDAILPASLFLGSRSARGFRKDGRLFALRESEASDRTQNYTIQMAQDRTADARFRKQFGVLVASVVGLGGVASALIAVKVTKRGLRPLERMAASLRRISPARLDERVASVAWPAELQPLALAFDEMLDRLQDSFTRLAQFSADLAHELRTPLANLRGEAEVALSRPRSHEEYREVIESSVGECERLSGIIDKLLFLARAEAADRQIQPTWFDGRAALGKIARYFQTLADERRIAIACEGTGEIFADATLFGQAVSNLVQNALRFTGDGGTITISLNIGVTQAEVSVRDNGCGISTEHLPRIFDRFYRADPARGAEGTGLGLALVKSIADLHGGSVYADSQVDEGTIVTLVFPKPDTKDSSGAVEQS